mmetsp:Transcript_14481/g.36238  ORF Transcript_14481/g.36238 Transcript_14481/m.36238 type:complete len:211 (+) Transcript_14481:295-927(+)
MVGSSGAVDAKDKKAELEKELKKCTDMLLKGNMSDLKFTEIQRELRGSLERLSVEQLRDEARNAGIVDVSKEDSPEELIRLILAADAKAAQDERDRRRWNKICFCCKRGDVISPEEDAPRTQGEKYLIRRKKRMQVLQDKDVAVLKKMCKSRGIEYEKWWDKGALCDAIITLEERQQADPDYQLARNLKILGAVSFVIVVVAIILILLAA